MSIFSASIQGNGDKATRQGTESSGVEARVEGSNIGAKVFCHVDKHGDDIVSIILTGGHSYPFRLKELGGFRLKDLQAQGVC